MLDSILEFIGGIIREAIPDLLRLLGACIKWIFYLGKRKFKDIQKEEWNMRVGFIFVVIMLVLFINRELILKN